jgi:glycosyltransferase involved in cell wall biosynthesis
MNAGAQLARGNWIAPLDDDDEFAPDHVEKLLTAALARDLEVVYGNILVRLPGSNQEDILWSTYPPQLGRFNFISALYMTPLRFIQYDVRSWMLNEPGDWNLCRRMMEAGVRIGWIDELVSYWYPGRLWAPPPGLPAQ